MFIFAILFFGILQDAGLFDPLINNIIKVTRGNVISVTVGTVLIAAIVHLDGAGASTFLITIPALLPLYKRLKMNPYLLLLLVGTSASIMNMVPWAGPLGRTASVLNVDVTELWRPLIPIQLIGLVLLVGLAAFLGIREKRRIAEKSLQTQDELGMEAEAEAAVSVDQQTDGSLKRPKMFWVNVLLAFSVIGLLVWGKIPAGFVFMIGISIALPLNYPNVKLQMDRINYMHQAHL